MIRFNIVLCAHMLPKRYFTLRITDQNSVYIYHFSFLLIWPDRLASLDLITLAN